MKRDDYDILNMSDEEIFELEKAMIECENDLNEPKHRNKIIIISVIIGIIVIVVVIGLILLLSKSQNLSEEIKGSYTGAGFGNNGIYIETRLELKENGSFQLTSIMPYIDDDTWMVFGTYTIEDNKVYCTTGVTKDTITYVYDSKSKTLKTDRNPIVLHKVD